MKTIFLTQGKVTVVDDDVYEWASKFKWCAAKDRGRFYAVRNIRRKSGKLRQHQLRLHREILKVSALKKVDHRDGDGLNNLRDNLRPATNSQNQRGFQRPKANKTSAFRGVCQHKGKWWARIVLPNRTESLGHFEIESEAARAYDAAAKTYYGEFAQLNFP